MAGEPTQVPEQTEGKRVIWAENIQFLARERGIKLMDLAKDADVTVSFFSRARKGETRADADVLSTIADLLGVSLDLLLKCDLSAMGKSDVLLVNSLEKLTRDTVAENIRWERISESALATPNKNGDLLYKFYTIVDDEPGERYFYGYKSPFEYGVLSSDKIQVDLDGDVYRAALTPFIDLYIVPVRVTTRTWVGNDVLKTTVNGVDMFFQTASGELRTMCCTYHNAREEISRKIAELFKTVQTKCEQQVLDPFTSELLSDYLNDRLDQRDDPPF